MRKIPKGPLAVLVALVVVAGVAGTATAASLSISPGGAITNNSLGQMTFTEPTTVCLINMSGTLTGGTISKVVGTSIGSITAATFRECTAGWTFRAESLPWSITYNSFLGVLPEMIRGFLLSLTGMAVETRNGGNECQYRGNLGVLLNVTRISEARYTSGLLATLGRTGSLPAIRSIGTCREALVFLGFFALASRQTIARI